MAWTIQYRYLGRSHKKEEYEDWSGRGAYDDLERAITLMVNAQIATTRDIRGGAVFQFRVYNHDTGEVIPFEALGL